MVCRYFAKRHGFNTKNEFIHKFFKLVEEKLLGDSLISGTFVEIEFIYSEKATKFCEIFFLVLYVVPVKSRVEISQNFVAFSEYMNSNMILGVWSYF